MQTMREAWTDERLDDLNEKVDRGFAGVETEMRAQRSELSELRAEMNARFEAMNARFDETNARFDALNRTLLGFAGVMIVALLVSRAVPL